MGRKAPKERKEKKRMSEEDQKIEETEEIKEEIPEVEGEVVDEKDAKIEALEAKVKEMEELVAKMKDDALRAAAETENYKKRLRADKDNAVKYANEQLLTDLLEPLDNFSRAIDAAATSEDFNAMKEGVVMVNEQMLSCLKQRWGLQMIEASVGTAYDPNTMEAYGVQEKEGIEKEEVGILCANGWTLNGKVIRTAKVFVAKPKK